MSLPHSFDVVVVGGNPGGITAAIGAARLGAKVVILERTTRAGGLIANGLGATDIATRGATGGLFQEFVEANHDHYVKMYGEDSEQVRVASKGYHFEPAVAERTIDHMLAKYERQITTLTERQFDALPDRVTKENSRITAIQVLNRKTGELETYTGKVFIDATYEGDLAAAAGANFTTRREAASEYHEPLAGKVYKGWGCPPGPGSTGEGDDTLQAFNYRLCLTNRADNFVPVTKPANYNRDDYASLVEDIKLGRFAGIPADEFALDGIGRVVNIIHLPNGKTDSNNQHNAFVSTDLPEENYPWPTADWNWRDQFAIRLREYELGLIWFVQNDPELPEDFRARCREWGLAADEYIDNGNFPRQVYVREGRRIVGEYLFTAHDALPTAPGARPPIHPNSVTGSHYALDSHAVHKREPGRDHLDGFLSHSTQPYTVPFGVILPKRVENLLTPVPVSGTHIGFSTLRMEPCWMALGQAAGVAAALAARHDLAARSVDTATLQRQLLDQGAILIYYKDVTAEHPAFKGLQFFGVRGAIPEWDARLDQPVTEQDLKRISHAANRPLSDVKPGSVTRGDLLQRLYAELA